MDNNRVLKRIIIFLLTAITLTIVTPGFSKNSESVLSSSFDGIIKPFLLRWCEEYVAYAHLNHLGSPILAQQDVRYTGKLFDASIGKHYFNARYLNAIMDTASPELPPRFLSPDIVIGSPGNPQGWNRYASCLNNPVRFVDPNGLDPINFEIGPVELAFDWEYIFYYPSAVLVYEDISTGLQENSIIERGSSQR